MRRVSRTFEESMVVQGSIRYYSIVAANLWLTWARSFESLARSSPKLQWQSSVTKGCTPNAAMLQSTCRTHDTNRYDWLAKYFRCSTKNLHILFLNPSWMSNDVASFDDSDSGELFFFLQFANCTHARYARAEPARTFLVRIVIAWQDNPEELGGHSMR